MSNILHSQEARTDVLAHVSDNLRRLRAEAGISQSALAERAKVSRRTIVSVEAGDTNISLSSLDRLAEALGVDFVTMVADLGADSRRIETVAWRGQDPASEAVLLGSAPARREAQLWSWTLTVGERYQAEPDPAGWHEMLYVIEGRLRLELQGETRTIDAPGFIIYSSAQSYAYANGGATPTRFLRIVVS